MSTIKKLAEVMKNVGFLKKDKSIQGGGNYMYLSEEKISGELHNAFAEQGLVIYSEDMEILENREDTTRAGNILHNTRIRVNWCVSDGEDAIHLRTLGEGSDSGDKCLNKCMTGSYKYALRQLLLISTGDDPDNTASQESTASTTHTPPAPQARPQTQTAEPVASASGARPVFFTSQVFEWMFQLGWTTTDENGKQKPTNAGFDFIGKLGVPTSGWKNWTPEQQAIVRQAFEQAIADANQPTLPEVDIPDSFADR